MPGGAIGQCAELQGFTGFPSPAGLINDRHAPEVAALYQFAALPDSGSCASRCERLLRASE